MPSALLDGYRKVMGNKAPVVPAGDIVIGKRYPYRVPSMQSVGGHPSAAQLTQRARFKSSLARFADVTEATRERWYAAMPPYSSFLWYYNYFIMSDLTGNADGQHGGFGVIKSIQFKTIAMPEGTGEGSVAITAVDPAKSVVMIFGASLIGYELEYGGLGLSVYPYVSSIAAELVKCKWSVTSWGGVSAVAANIGITVIEYI